MISFGDECGLQIRRGVNAQPFDSASAALFEFFDISYNLLHEHMNKEAPRRRTKRQWKAAAL